MDGSPLDSEVNANIPFLTLLTSVAPNNVGGSMDIWAIRDMNDNELSSDDEEEIQQARKFINGFNEEDLLFNQELLQLSQNLNANWDHGNHSEGDASEYEESSDPDSPISSSEEEIDQGRKKKRDESIRYNPNTKPEDTFFFVGQEFTDAKEFKKALSNYSICHARDIYFTKNMYSRVGARCKADRCSWKIWASQLEKDGKFSVKTFTSEHSCGRSNYVHRMDSNWIADYYLPKFRVSPIWRIVEMKNTIWSEFGIQVGDKRCINARTKAWSKLFGQYKQQYEMLPYYAVEIFRANSNNTVKIKCDNNVFQRFYICFDSLRKGFLAGCRPFISLDGCFLKGPFGGQLLAAVGRDGNNQMYPIAWAVVESEQTDSWSWFLQLLANDLGTTDGRGFTLMSDQQKGLLNAIQNLWPAAEQRSCARHVYANIRALHGAAEIRKCFWAIAKSSTTNRYEKSIEQMKKISISAVQDLIKRHPERWCRAFFGVGSSCDSVDNNMVEVFNAYILASRHKPIISMLEDVREAIQGRLHRKRDEIGKRDNPICPRIQLKLEKSKLNSKGWLAGWDGGHSYGVKYGYGGEKYVVNLKEKTCACREWQLSGIPCLHAVAAIWANGEQPENYVACWFHKQHYLKAYDFALEPLNGPDEWPKSSNPPIYAPVAKTPIGGRPPKKRRREIGETQQRRRKLSNKGKQKKCEICGQAGHNKTKCVVVGNGNFSQGQGNRNQGTRKKKARNEYQQTNHMLVQNHMQARDNTRLDARESGEHGHYNDI